MCYGIYSGIFAAFFLMGREGAIYLGNKCFPKLRKFYLTNGGHTRYNDLACVRVVFLYTQKTT